MKAARIVRDAAVTAGAPEHCVQWIATHTSVSNNVSAAHLLNVARVSTRRNNPQWFKVPPKISFEPQSTPYPASMPEALAPGRILPCAAG